MSNGDNEVAGGEPHDEGPVEIAFVGDLTDNEGELTDRLLSVPPGGECTLGVRCRKHTKGKRSVGEFSADAGHQKC